MEIAALSGTFTHALSLTLINKQAGGAMKIPKELEIPAVVFALQGVMLLGWILVFFVL